MNAEQARKLTQENLRGPVIAEFVAQIDEDIRQTCLKGKSCIHLWSSVGGRYPTTDEQKALRVHYEQLGFTITDYDNPDPGHPCSSDYTELTW